MVSVVMFLIFSFSSMILFSVFCRRRRGGRVGSSSILSGTTLIRSSRLTVPNAPVHSSSFDPIQPERNAAAALSEEAFKKFTDAAKAFLKRPSPDYFMITPVTPLIIKEYYLQHYGRHDKAHKPLLFILEGRPLEGKDDVVATKLRKAHERIVEEAARHGFSVLANGWEWSKKQRTALSYLIFKQETLSAAAERPGPPLVMKKACERFKLEHKNARSKNGRLVATVPRTYRTPKAFLAGILQEEYVTSRAKRFVWKSS